ncbi:stage II sporulation protein M [Brevundimonas subvibrioides]|uniref:stage II sporulation protein M n=1 Tax=Brevundimonas subvibrioides TaxID=74313 RepID=UPI0022B3A53D|nr:stage II sporulation protein M [Brevundimonas subvibrioides]
MAREDDWKRLERLMDKVEKGSAGKLSDDEILVIPVLYRSTLSALSVARETSLDLSLISYLETLSARAYFFVYGSRSTLQGRLASFFSVDWPRAVGSLWRETLIAGAMMILGAVAAAWLVGHDAEWFYAFVPAELAGGRDPGASTATLRDTLSGVEDRAGLSVFATFLFTHNAQIALLAFALGFAFCIPSALLMLYNGATLGAFFILFASRGLGVEVGGWLMIHGVTELFAVTLAGAAGLRIGWAVMFPGSRHRLEAAKEAGRAAGTVVGGVVIMLFIAGLLEGFGRQLITDTGSRYAIGLATGVLWGTYFYAPRRRGTALSYSNGQ